jgi:hypothetical protein
MFGALDRPADRCGAAKRDKAAFVPDRSWWGTLRKKHTFAAAGVPPLRCVRPAGDCWGRFWHTACVVTAHTNTNRGVRADRRFAVVVPPGAT